MNLREDGVDIGEFEVDGDGVRVSVSTGISNQLRSRVTDGGSRFEVVLSLDISVVTVEGFVEVDVSALAKLSLI